MNRDSRQNASEEFSKAAAEQTTKGAEAMLQQSPMGKLPSSPLPPQVVPEHMTDNPATSQAAPEQTAKGAEPMLQQSHRGKLPSSPLPPQVPDPTVNAPPEALPPRAGQDMRPVPPPPWPEFITRELAEARQKLDNMIPESFPQETTEAVAPEAFPQEAGEELADELVRGWTGKPAEDRTQEPSQPCPERAEQPGDVHRPNGDSDPAFRVIAAYRRQALHNPDPLLASLGVFGAGWMKAAYRVNRAIDRELRASQNVLATAAALAPDIERALRLTRQTDRFFQMDLRARARRRPASQGEDSGT
jgi:hypothetical protein